MHVVVIIKRKLKKISRSSFACWELSRVNSFYRSCFAFFRETKNSKNIFSVFLWNSFLFFGGRKEKTTMKMLSGSHMHYCWSNKEPILPCLLLWINVCRYQLSPMHMHYYYYPHCSVVRVKGKWRYMMDWLRWEKLVWTRPILFCKYD